MAREYITIFNQQYRNNAKPRNTEDDRELEKVCWACNQPFLENQPIHVCYSGSRPHRRHVTCAVVKGVTTESKAKRLLDEVARDMQIELKAVMKTTAAYQLYVMTKKD